MRTTPITALFIDRLCGRSSGYLARSCKPWSLPPATRAPFITGDIHRSAVKEPSVYGLVGPKWIERITSVNEAGITAVGQLFFQLLDGLANHAKRRAGLELVLDLDE